MRQITSTVVGLFLASATTACEGRVDMGANPPASATKLAARQQYLSVGQSYACGILASGPVSCWTLLDQLPTPPTAPAHQFVDISVGPDFACGVDTNSDAICWSLDVEHTAPTAPGGGFRSVRVGEGWACGIRVDWSIECWGKSHVLQPPVGRFVDIALGDGFLCGIRDSGMVACVSSRPLISGDIPSGQFTHLTSSKFQVCALRTESTPYCWGAPQEVSVYPLKSPVSAVAAGAETRCALTPQGEVVCWGNMVFFGMASVPTDNSNVSVYFPFSRSELFADLHLGYLLSGLCATRRDGTVVCKMGLKTISVPGVFVTPR